MKQILSVADLATMLQLVNDAIGHWEAQSNYVSDENWTDKGIVKLSKKEAEEKRFKQIERMRNNPEYQSLIHLKTALENLNVEIETPELKVEDEDDE